MSNNYTSALGVSGGGVQPTGNAQPADVLSGKTFSNADGVGKTGTMVNNGAVSQTLSGGQSYTIPEGYHNGSGIVSAIASGLLENNGDYIDLSTSASDTQVIGTYTGSPIGPNTGNVGHFLIVNVTEYNSATCDGRWAVYAWGLKNNVFTPIPQPSGLTADVSAYDYFIVLTNNRPFTFS